MPNSANTETEPQQSRSRPVLRSLAAFACIGGAYEIIQADSLPNWLRIGGGALFFAGAIYNINEALPDSNG